MDIINVTDSALQNASGVLQQLKDLSSATTTNCVSVVSSNLNGVDESFKKDLQVFIESITALNKKISICMNENTTALGERLSKIPDYESQSYKKRTFY